MFQCCYNLILECLSVLIEEPLVPEEGLCKCRSVSLSEKALLRKKYLHLATKDNVELVCFFAFKEDYLMLIDVFKLKIAEKGDDSILHILIDVTTEELD